MDGQKIVLKLNTTNRIAENPGGLFDAFSTGWYAHIKEIFSLVLTG